ncbi:MAG: alpha/beta hydrolase [Gemmataceae bacterium]|nr:alpha/beta hydrolase [Gemmata sp.]MDW8196210.1 alpha/beta hydrolase [Gemmataceae bacterium]
MVCRSSVLVFLLVGVGPAAAAEPTVIKLWPGQAPGETKDLGPEKYLETKKGQLEVKRLTNVTEPTITIYPVAKEKNTATAVIVAPGGGYNILAIEHEGTDVCQWLNKLGVTAVLLKYRVPRREMQTPENLAMIQDAQRAVILVRSQAKEYGIDPNRIGMLGFSAGGNLTAWTCLTTKRMYDKIDATDETFSHQPNFGLLIYPGGLIDKDGNLKPEFTVTNHSPPMFFAHSSDDNISSENSIALYLALKKNKVPAEMHLYASGGHGYGLRPLPHPCASWPDRAAEWMKSRGLLDPPSR